ncbi:MAG: hypothetical protein V3T83_12945 [Acidobacteriota bacterium]
MPDVAVEHREDGAIILTVCPAPPPSHQRYGRHFGQLKRLRDPVKSAEWPGR